MRYSTAPAQPFSTSAARLFHADVHINFTLFSHIFTRISKAPRRDAAAQWQPQQTKWRAEPLNCFREWAMELRQCHRNHLELVIYYCHLFNIFWYMIMCFYCNYYDYYYSVCLYFSAHINYRRRRSLSVLFVVGVGWWACEHQHKRLQFWINVVAHRLRQDLFCSVCCTMVVPVHVPHCVFWALLYMSY